MTLDLDAIAREVGLIELRDVWADLPADYTQALSRFAALLLEKAAQVCDGHESEWLSQKLYSHSHGASECARAIRSMAAGMGE